MSRHTTVFYVLVALMAMAYYAVNKAFGMTTDINIFYVILTGVVVIAYGLYVNYKKEGNEKKIKILFAVCAIIAVADIAACVSFLPKYTYSKAQQIVEESYEEAKTAVEMDFPQFFTWGEHKFSKGCYVFFYDVEGDLYVYTFDQFSGDNKLSRIVEDYDIETAAEKIVKEECIVLD